MSIYLAFDGKVQTQIASNKGWSDVVRYVEGLPSHYKTLKRFVDRGYDARTRRVIYQLRHAMRHQPPEDETIAKTIGELLYVLGDSRDVIMITDGLS